jgi:hypothetical protein
MSQNEEKKSAKESKIKTGAANLRSPGTKMTSRLSKGWREF